MLVLWHLYQISPTNHWYLLFVRLFEKDMFEGRICTHTVFEITPVLNQTVSKQSLLLENQHGFDLV